MKTILSYVFFNRLFIIIIAIASFSFIGYVDRNIRGGDSQTFTMNQGDHVYTYRQPDSKLLNMWSVWDTKWYISIAEDGYGKSRVPFEHTDNKGFLPLFPILIWFFSTFLFFGNTHLAGLLISNVCLILALFFFKKLIQSEPRLTESVDMKDIWWYVLLFPTSYYLSAIYSESLFLLLSILVFYFVNKKGFVKASFIFSLACLTKTFGIFLIIPIIIGIFKQKHTVSFSQLLACIPAAATLPLIYCAYMYHISGDPLAYIHIQQLFFRHSWREPIHVMTEALFYKNSFANTWNSLFALFSLGALYLAAKKIPYTYTLYALVYIMFTPFTGVMDGSSRYMTTLFVVPIALATIIKNPEKKKYLLMVFSLVQGFTILWWVAGVGFAS